MIKTVFALFFGICSALLVTLVAGESPFHIAWVLTHSAFGSRYDFGMTLFYASPLIFTGLAVAIPFRAGLFNIGAEGQLTMGALAAALGVGVSELAAEAENIGT